MTEQIYESERVSAYQLECVKQIADQSARMSICLSAQLTLVTRTLGFLAVGAGVTDDDCIDQLRLALADARRMTAEGTVQVTGQTTQTEKVNDARKH